MGKLTLNNDALAAWENSKKCHCGYKDCHPNNHRICYLCEDTILKCAHRSISSQQNSWYLWDVDHIISISRGGSNQQNNLRAVHVRCNREKGNRY